MSWLSKLTYGGMLEFLGNKYLIFHYAGLHILVYFLSRRTFRSCRFCTLLFYLLLGLFLVRFRYTPAGVTRV
jgi:hypothetical protein